MEDVYKFDNCKVCGRFQALKNDICPLCAKTCNPLQDIFGDMFNSIFGRKQ